MTEKIIKIIILSCLDWLLQKGLTLGDEIMEHKSLKKSYADIDKRRDEASKYLKEELAKLKSKTELSEEEANAISDSIADEYFKRLG